MTKHEIINELANNKEVEKIVYKLLPSSKNPFDEPLDLIQDVYLILLDKPSELIESLYRKDEIGWYVISIVKHQLLSDHSPYYYKYVKLRSQSDDVSKAETHKPGED